MKGNKETIQINGSSIKILNNKIYINGKEYVPKGENISEVEFEGNAKSINSDCSFSIKGNVDGDVDAGGSINIIGDVKGDIDAGGSVNISGKHIGDIDAGGSVSIIGG